jgi:D-alanyl-lipoteichoic acid acyltransferase DltB (MBOAT superfamily)
MRAMTGQSVELASSLDIPWLGFSFLAFRLLHMLRDYQGGKLPANTLGEAMTFNLFFPTYTAGPIDRLPRYTNELRQVAAPLDKTARLQNNSTNLLQGGQRLVWGLFKKFVLADSLALIALSPQNASQVESTLWMWLMLYAYALRLYFDFAGYTDIAIGLGNIMGFRLPENFDRPYLKGYLTAFWNSWHITLAQWFRAYYFNPLTRGLRSSSAHLSPWIVILIGQFSTMLLIGLWHGLTWNFFLWGAWHGLGLFVHNRWLDWTRLHLNTHTARPPWAWLTNLGSWALTFNFVSLGWVWFVMPDPQTAGQVMLKLFGF